MQNPITPIKKFTARHQTMIVATVAAAVTAAGCNLITKNALSVQKENFLWEIEVHDKLYHPESAV